MKNNRKELEWMINNNLPVSGSLKFKKTPKYFKIEGPEEEVQNFYQKFTKYCENFTSISNIVIENQINNLIIRYE